MPMPQAASLIGRQGATIKSIQEASNCIVRVIDDLPPFAMQEDKVVEIVGETTVAHKALELVSAHLRKFLVDRSVLPLFEIQLPVRAPYVEQSMPPFQPWGHPQGLRLGPAVEGYEGNPFYIPPRTNDNFYPPHEVPHFVKQPHYGISIYGSDVQASNMHLTANQHAPLAAQITHHMQVPLSYADAVIGASGINISYIRRASGATVTIQETRGVPGEMTVEINGSSSQVQTAQQLIQNYMAEAAAQVAPPLSLEQSYGSYQGHGGPMYGAPPANPGPPGSGYAPAHGANYGY